MCTFCICFRDGVYKKIARKSFELLVNHGSENNATFLSNSIEQKPSHKSKNSTDTEKLSIFTEDTVFDTLFTEAHHKSLS